MMEREQARQHAATLASLIDHENDDLARLLEPIRHFLLGLAEPRLGDDQGPGTYQVAVSYQDCDDLRHDVGTWEGWAESVARAHQFALDEFEDGAIDGWESRVLNFTPPGNDGYSSLEECKKSELHLTDCDDDGYCNYCGHQEPN